MKCRYDENVECEREQRCVIPDPKGGFLVCALYEFLRELGEAEKSW